MREERGELRVGDEGSIVSVSGVSSVAVAVIGIAANRVRMIAVARMRDVRRVASVFIFLLPFFVLDIRVFIRFFVLRGVSADITITHFFAVVTGKFVK